MNYKDEREELLELAGMFRELRDASRPGTKTYHTYDGKLRVAQDRMLIARVRRHH